MSATGHREFDQVIHAPARLRIMTILGTVDRIEFATLRDRLDVSDSVMSKHLAALAAADYVTISKSSLSGRRTTWVAGSSQGRRALRQHVAALRAMIADVPGP
ncbi:MAG: transcriptional regulator [Nocardioides sp.]